MSWPVQLYVQSVEELRIRGAIPPPRTSTWRGA
jgi:hypothetical protein